MPVPDVSLRLSSISARSSAGTGIRSVSFEVARGGVHGVLGENLSGASELLAVIGGYLPVTAGRLEIDGAAASFGGHAAAEAAGVAVVRGEPNIVPHLSVAENVFLGREKSLGGIVRFGRMYAESAAILERLGLAALPVRKPAGDLDAGERRVLELARTLVAGRRLVLIDEPFSGLDARGLAVVARGIAGLAAAGLTVVVATYRADMLLRVAGSITVLSRGRAVETLRVAGGGASVEARLVGYMTTNIHVVRRIRHESIEPGPVVLDVRGWSAFHPLDATLAVVRDVSLTVRAGEIVGLAGLDGSGISELALSLFGRSYGPAVSGEILLGGHPFTARSPAESIAAGLSLATDTNTTYDLGLLGGVPSRISPSTLARLARLGLIDRKRDYRTAAPAFGLGGISDLVRGARLPGGGAGQAGLESLEGAAGADAVPGAAAVLGADAQPRGAGPGSRAREALEIWLGQAPERRPQAVILDHSTRGVGPEAAQQLRDLTVQLAASGTGVLLVSADIEELLIMTTRVYTMVDGRVTAELSTLDASPQNLLAPMIRPLG
ncbi:MAG: sugar transporter ATP-binding protein [Subtercola sp.]|nr:sugar transporter ATP-binding protein [Subtercola sp.]